MWVMLVDSNATCLCIWGNYLSNLDVWMSGPHPCVLGFSVGCFAVSVMHQVFVLNCLGAYGAKGAGC